VEVRAAVPDCPYPSLEAIGEVEYMVATSQYENTRRWLATIERYCSAISSMNGG
jgi:hypothetical protein|tara:strand:+ start:1639 stop:1800 length:162 start_codon:yes stop_codon:yes gene_type:complete